MCRREMKRLDLHFHLSLTFCHKYAVCQISYARREGARQGAPPQLLHRAAAPRAEAPRAVLEQAERPSMYQTTQMV